MKCTACGSTTLIGGIVRDSNSAEIRFYPSDMPALKRLFGMGGKAVHAHVCIHCHNLQFAVEFSEGDLERYQQFEGEQPGVLERINSK
jgi:hypothetical protein